MSVCVRANMSLRAGSPSLKDAVRLDASDSIRLLQRTRGDAFETRGPGSLAKTGALVLSLPPAPALKGMNSIPPILGTGAIVCTFTYVVL